MKTIIAINQTITELHKEISRNMPFEKESVTEQIVNELYIRIERLSTAKKDLEDFYKLKSILKLTEEKKHPYSVIFNGIERVLSKEDYETMEEHLHHL